MTKKKIYGEAAMLTAIVLNSAAVSLLVKCSFGVSATTSIGYILSVIFPQLTQGTWLTIFQLVLTLIVICATRRFKIGFSVAFGLAALYGAGVDLFDYLLSFAPDTIPVRVICFVASFALLSVGVCFMMRCKVPVLPMDTFTRELTEYFNIDFAKFKTAFDCVCVGVTIILSLIWFKSIVGVGVTTIINALCLGKSVAAVGRLVDKHFYFEPRFEAIGKMSR